MQTNDALAAANSQARPKLERVASWSHLAGFLAIMAGMVVMGFLAQRAAGGSGAATAGGQLASHGSAIQIYLVAAFMDWALLYYCWVGVHWLLGASSAKTVDSLLPKSLLEILVWIGVSITAGICEELAFRGYLQRQFHALGGPVVAVIGQGLVFGLAHAYQGWKNVVVICALGILFGILAAWRKNLRANILVHAWADIWGGWLQMLVLR